MLHVVTGAAGFIGSRLLAALNREGITEILAVDNLENVDKVPNLAGCEIEDYLDKREFLARLEAGQFDGSVEAILHQGACSDTMATDGRYVMDNNYRYSRALLDWCQEEEVPLVYASSASVYGAGASGFIGMITSVQRPPSPRASTSTGSRSPVPAHTRTPLASAAFATAATSAR